MIKLIVGLIYLVVSIYNFWKCFKEPLNAKRVYISIALTLLGIILVYWALT